MPKVKILVTEDNGDYDTYSRFISDSITDWEDISAEDLEFLKKYRYDLQKELFGHQWDRTLLIIEKDTEFVAKRITDLKELVAAKIKREAAAKAKRSAAAKLSKEKREAKRRENELARLKALADKHGVEIDDSAFPGGLQGAKT